MRRALAAVGLLVALAACGGSDAKDASACGSLPSADPAAALPAGFPTRDQVLYEHSSQGKTVIVFGLVKGSDFVEVRDDYVSKLKTAGWTVDGTDQEAVEAEAQFSKAGPSRTGTIKVQPFCTGYVSVRYKLNS